ncbi:class I SAM-dependent methyltransferase [Nitrosomonadaceae bacterium]|nr:class I SAM-dependent methyltransferase [Nitrosomonadaceae bacterium]
MNSLPLAAGNDRKLALDDYAWLLRCMAQTDGCRALQTPAERDAATRLTQLLGLPSHHDPQKNWDTLKCFYYILQSCDSSSPVLDAGSSSKSVILRWLDMIGFQDLHACDLTEEKAKYKNSRIKFQKQDLSNTNYPSNHFQVITSISVIEHGVALDKYVAEMARLLKPGGLLLTSTDYWSEYIDCRGIYPYGQQMPEMKVFQPSEIEQLCELAESAGLSLCQPLDLTTTEKSVYWERVDREYTFIFFALKKTR